MNGPNLNDPTKSLRAHAREDGAGYQERLLY